VSVGDWWALSPGEKTVEGYLGSFGMGAVTSSGGSVLGRGFSGVVGRSVSSGGRYSAGFPGEGITRPVAEFVTDHGFGALAGSFNETYRPGGDQERVDVLKAGLLHV
jgi:hypothetical protein